MVDLVRSDKYDLLILDVMLPHTSGFEICRQIRRDPENYTLPILILSAMNSEEEIYHGLAQGADDFVSKPFDAMNLVQRAEALLRAGTAGVAIDDLTSLPGAEATKRELQRRISLKMSLALVHTELVGLREFGRKYGPEARSKGIRHLGRALAQCAQELAPDDSFVGHMGGGHFMSILPREKVQTFCKWVNKVWESHMTKFLSGLAPTTAPRPGERLLPAVFCVTVRERRDSTTPQQMFEVLSQLRHMALEANTGGVYLDRRARLDKAAESDS
ncbi:MAG: response regulator [Candidatus Hydrogenedentales bacterium]